MRFFLRRFMLAALFFMPLPLQAGHGLSIDGSLKYPKNFERFAYTKSVFPLRRAISAPR